MSLPTQGFSFEVDAVDGAARSGRFTTPRATVETPAFMPVGTQATVKALTPDDVASTGARMILANTYHLWLRPGAESIASHGGVVGFMRWPHALLTDSGGYQVFSLAKHRIIDDDAAAEPEPAGDDERGDRDLTQRGGRVGAVGHAEQRADESCCQRVPVAIGRCADPGDCRLAGLRVGTHLLIYEGLRVDDLLIDAVEPHSYVELLEVIAVG